MVLKRKTTETTSSDIETSSEDNVPISGPALEALVRQSLDDKLEIFGDIENNFVLALRDLKAQLDLADGTKVIYPGSSTHVGVARVFGKENVVHVDPSEEACQSLSGSGYQVAQTGIEDYLPSEKADLLVALNSYGEPTPAILERVLEPGALIIANNYTLWAHELNAIDGVAMIGAVMPAYSSPDASFVAAPEVPETATDIISATYHFKDGQQVDHHHPEGFSFTDQEPNFPDALFVFQLDS